MNLEASDGTLKWWYVFTILWSYYLIAYLILACLRIIYPFELEWTEGAMVDHVVRILRDEKLYVAPSINFVPFIYPPVYYYIAALVSMIAGEGFFPLRLVSFTSSLGCFAVIFAFVYRETKCISCGIVASCFYAATYGLTRGWFDIARVDSLFIFLLLSSYYVFRFYTGRLHLLVAAALSLCCLMTKQTALIAIAPVMAYLSVNDKRFLLWCTLPFLALSTGTWILMDLLHEGWFTFYTFSVPFTHPIDDYFYWGFWYRDILSPLFIGFIMGLSAIICFVRNNRTKGGLFYFLCLIGTILVSWSGRLHVNGASNVVMPFYGFISILVGLSMYFAADQFRSSRHRYSLPSVLICASIVQFTLLLYDPMKFLPTKEDLKAGSLLVTSIRDMEGDLYMPYHGYVPTLANKKTFAHAMAITDVLQSKQQTTAWSLEDDIKMHIIRRKFNTIILDNLDWYKDIRMLHYGQIDKIFSENDVFRPVSGWRTRPQFVFTPKRDN